MVANNISYFIVEELNPEEIKERVRDMAASNDSIRPIRHNDSFYELSPSSHDIYVFDGNVTVEVGRTYRGHAGVEIWGLKEEGRLAVENKLKASGIRLIKLAKDVGV